MAMFSSQPISMISPWSLGRGGSLWHQKLPHMLPFHHSRRVYERVEDVSSRTVAELTDIVSLKSSSRSLRRLI